MLTRNNIIEASNFIVRYACEHTISGCRYVDVDFIACNTHMTCDEVRTWHKSIMDEMCKRIEILEVEFCKEEDCFDVDCGLSYCPSYEWCDGDEDVFRCSYEEWLNMNALPIVDAPFV